MQLPEFHPTPARCPTLSPLAFGPTAVTRPMTSWPRIAGYCEMPPVIVQDGEIRVTQTAVFDSDFNILGPEGSEINGFEHHRLFRRLRNPCLIIHRVSYIDLCVVFGHNRRHGVSPFYSICNSST